MSSLKYRREIAMPRLPRAGGFPDFRPAMPFTFGDMLYASSSLELDNVPPNTSTTRKVLTQIGNGTTAGAPVWGVVSLVEDPTKVAKTMVAMLRGRPPCRTSRELASRRHKEQQQ